MAPLALYVVRAPYVSGPAAVGFGSDATLGVILLKLTFENRFSTAFRVACNVNVSDSFGTLVTNGASSHPSPVGMSRVSDATSLCT